MNSILLENLCDERLKEIKNYLESPTHSGIWKLDVVWSRDNAFYNMLKIPANELMEKVKQSKDNYTILDVGKRRVRVENRKIRVNLPIALDKVSVIYAIFFNAAAEELELESDGFLSLPNENIITEYLVERGTELFRSKKEEFKESFEFFKDKILCDNFIPKLHRLLLNRVKDGFYNVAGEQASEEYVDKGKISFSLHAQSRKPLETLEEFFTGLGVTKSTTMSMVFSPEEEVFQDYVKYLDFSKDKLFKKGNINNLFHRAISHHNDKNYLECVSNVGLIAEDLLTQIYETLYREPVVKGLTIGQLHSTINAKIQALYSSNKIVEQPEIKPLFQDIKSVIDSEEPSVSESLAVMRKMLTYMSEQNKFMTYKIDSGSKKPKAQSIYSKDITESIDELLKYRNAASHRSKVPIGQYEAIRSLYCSVKFYLWWEREKLKIDWSSDKDQIIKDMVARYT